MTPLLQRFNWIKRLLLLPNVDAWIICASMLLLATSLTSGFSADDYVHKLILSQSGEIEGFDRSRLDLFRFTAGDGVRSLKRDGVVSWWADPKARFAFWRPASALTHWLDYVLWPDSSAMAHLHCMLWGLLVFLGVRSLFRSLWSSPVAAASAKYAAAAPWVASLALFLYVLDDSRAWFASFVATRNATVATALSIWVLIFYHRFRAQQWKPGALLAPLMLVPSVLAGEGAVAICAYLLAYALFLDTGPLWRRLFRLAPYALIVLVWRVVYTALGYGVAGSGLYIDPLRDPWRFFLACCERAPILLFAQWGGFWSGFWTTLFVFPRIAQLLLAAAVLFLLIVGWMFVPLFKRDRLVRFALAGALLSTPTACATFTSDRLLSWISIGASIALARFLVLYIDSPADLGLSRPASRLAPGIMLGLVVPNIILAPLVLPSRANGNTSLRGVLERADAGVPRTPDIVDKSLIFVNPPAVPLVSYIPMTRAVTNTPRPKTQHWLATSTTEVLLERLDATTLRVRPKEGFLINPSDMLLRSPTRPLKLNQKIDLGPLTIRITEMTPDQRPAEILARFTVALEHPSLYWLAWRDAGFVPFKPPAIGKKVLLPSADYARIAFTTPMPFVARYTPKEDETL